MNSVTGPFELEAKIDAWPLRPLADALLERRETPDPDDLISGKVKIVAKVGFRNGQIELRSETETNTGMILVRPGDLLVSGINAAKGAVAVYDSDASGPIA